jgi:hypothetical protein
MALQPQLSGVSSFSQPLSDRTSQLLYCSWQACRHVPDSHRESACGAAAGHFARSQPQSWTESCFSQPFVSLPSQSEWPGSHMHRPFGRSHRCMTWVPIAVGLPQSTCEQPQLKS